MRFLMVDRICALEKGKHARGIKNISLNDTFLEEQFPDVPVYSPIVLCEAAAQLVSWIIVQARDFTVKPVITIVDSYDCHGLAMPGDQLEILGEVESFSEESALAHGSILLNGKPIVEMKHCVCYLYPLDELDPPEVMRTQFQNLYREGAPPAAAAPADRLECLRERIHLPPRCRVDRVLASESSEHLQAVKNVTATADYFNHHFPRKPILPGVLILDALIGTGGLLADRLLQERGQPNKKAVLQHCDKIKFRAFIQPGDQLIIDARVAEFSDAKSTVKIKASLNGKNAAMLTVSFAHLDREGYVEKFISNI
ncbi:3-hydroxyacyl-ACP dehydratase FabZ family protein [Thermodesulfobacteriota bacterium]